MSADSASSNTRLEKEGRAFLIFIRGFVLLCVVLAGFVAFFDDKSPLLNRFIAGGLVAVGAFIFVALGKGPFSRLYALGLAALCLLLGSFGGATCVLDPSCVPRDRGLTMLAATFTFACAAAVFNAYPRRSIALLLSRCAAIISITVVAYFGYFDRAMGGAVMFLMFAVVALLAAVHKGDYGVDERQTPALRPTRAHSALAVAGASSMYWYMAYARDWVGSLVIVAIGTAWLGSVVYEAWRARSAKPVAH